MTQDFWQEFMVWKMPDLDIPDVEVNFIDFLFLILYSSYLYAKFILFSTDRADR